MNIQPVDRHFSKQERLCGEIRTENLFASGKGFIIYPLRIVYLVTDKEEIAPVRVLFSVPKKKIRLSVKRNRIKRLLRENYRINKHLLIAEMEKKDASLHLGIVYLSNEMPDYSFIGEKMSAAMQRLLKSL